MRKPKSLLVALFGLAFLAGCGEELAFRTITLAPGSAECPAGGTKLEWGEDSNEDKVLQDGEVTGSSLSCNVPLIVTTRIIESGQNGCNYGGIAVVYGHDTNGDEEIDVVQNEVVHCNSDKYLVSTTDIAPGAGSECPHGGIMLKFGDDTNGNRQLDPSEVTKEQKICQQRVDGHAVNCNSVMIVDGKTTLTRTRVAPTTSCAFGGFYLDIGLDTNRNNTLESGEVTNTSYICHGVQGTAGVNALVNVVSYSGLQYGINGGVEIQTGLDNNRNNVLDSSEITKRSYVCDGYDGIVEVTGGYYSDCDGGWGILVEGGTDLDGNAEAPFLFPTDLVCSNCPSFTGASFR